MEKGTDETVKLTTNEYLIANIRIRRNYRIIGTLTYGDKLGT